MQVYRELRVLTARPTAVEEALAEHRLYGHVSASRAYSTGAWLADVLDLVRTGALAGRPVIFVGGTGLYFRSLLGGLSAMPDVPVEIRARWRLRLRAEGSVALHAELGDADAQAAATLRPSDGQRIVRALEILETTGRSILAWQVGRGAPLVDPDTAERLVVQVDRAVLVEAIARRFDRMIETGAAEEVQKLLQLGLDPALPAMKAIGVREISAALTGRISLEEARRLAKIASHQYAKRQATWFRNQLGSEWRRVHPDEQNW